MATATNNDDTPLKAESSNLPPGLYTCVFTVGCVFGPQYKKIEKIQLEAGKVEERKIHISNGRLIVTMEDEHGRRIANSSAFIKPLTEHTNNPEWEFTTFYSSGSMGGKPTEYHHLPPGDYEVTAKFKDMTSERVTVRVEDFGEPTSIKLILRPPSGKME